MRVRVPIVALGVVAALGALWLALAGGPGPARPTAGDQIIFFGDSLVRGVGASPGRDVASILSRRLRVPIVNAGRSGDTTGAALARLDAAVLSRRPRVVVVLLGGNDILRRVPRRQTIDNLEAIVTRIRERGAGVVLASVEIGILSAGRGDYEALAERTASALVPDVLDGVFGRQDLMADGIHPNNRGYEIIADRIEPALRDLIGD
jgi:lysophospholipase L1-like esterase